MDKDAHRRIIAEVKRVGRKDASEITKTTDELRDILLQPIEDAEEVLELTPAQAVPHQQPAAAAPPPPQPVQQPAPEPQAAPAPPPYVAPVEQPAAAPAPAAGLPVPARSESQVGWQRLATVDVASRVLDKSLVITANRIDPAHASFDVLRTRLVQALAEKGWRRVAITSPSGGCGKSFTAMNLAVTLSRYDNFRTVLMDMDMRRPALAKYLGVKSPGSLGDVLRGETTMTQHLRRISSTDQKIGQNLALGLNDKAEDYAAELFQQQSTKEALGRMEYDLAPDVILYDLPPALAQDDVMAFRPYFDCVLMVVGGGISTAKEIREVHRRLGDDKPVLGVVLNMAEDQEDNTY